MNKMRISFLYQIKSEIHNDLKNPPVCDIIMLKFEINLDLSLFIVLFAESGDLFL